MFFPGAFEKCGFDFMKIQDEDTYVCIFICDITNGASTQIDIYAEDIEDHPISVCNVRVI